MFQCSFMFIPRARDDEFFLLDNAIASYAESLSGFLGSESWFSEDKKKINQARQAKEKSAAAAAAGEAR